MLLNNNNMKNRFKLIVTASVLTCSYALQAKENVGVRIATSQTQADGLDKWRILRRCFCGL